MNKEYIVDIEANGLLEDATKIHCVSFGWVDEKGEFKVASTTDYDAMRVFFSKKENTCIGHNFNLYDALVLEKLLNIKVQCKIIDTLGISWYLQPTRGEHNLESYARDYGDNKVEIDDWHNLPVKEYISRCEKDVILQNKVWNDQKTHLLEIYRDEKEVDRFINYIAFKLDCVRDQLSLGLKFDIALANTTLDKLTKEQKNKLEKLAEAMPKVPIMGVKKMPVKMYNSKSELSVVGKRWCEFLQEQGLPITHTRDVEYVRGYEEPNPNSHVQIKNWLFSLGWKPEHFKFNRNKKTGETKQIPQIASKELDGNLCNSILKLARTTPALEELNGLSVINHRIAVFNGMLNDKIEDRIYQNIWGFTNTMRLTHKTLVNLPKVTVPYGKEIRGSLTADPGYILCGSDLSGLEDNTKQHYIYNYDPEYVKEMRTPGFDPHLDIAVLAKMLTPEQAAEHKLYSKTKGKEGKDHSEVRYKAKTTNFSATYGAGARKIAQTAGVPLVEGEILHSIYWKRNWAVKKTAEDAIVKTVRDQMWIYNPISRFWYSLRYEKDRFSTLNQSSGVYVFDTWVAFVRKEGIRIALQMHDEILFNVEKGEEEKTEQKINNAMAKTNALLKLNIEIGCSTQFGQRYSDCH